MTSSPAVSLPGGECAAPEPVLRIERSRGWRTLHLRELWQYRELIWFLTLRDIKIRYKQTLLGASWAIIQPVFTMAVFSLFFGRLAKMPSDGVPYPIFALAALSPWTFFATGLTQASNSLVGNSNLVTKVYFPRLIVPLAAVLSGLVDLLLSLLVLSAMMLWYDIQLRGTAAYILPLLLVGVAACLGVGFWLSALNVEYRDVRHMVPFIVQFWMFATPIAYPSSLLAEPWRTVYGLNPMVGVVEGFRWALFGTSNPPLATMAVSAAAGLVFLAFGAAYFRKVERTFADVI